MTDTATRTALPVDDFAAARAPRSGLAGPSHGRPSPPPVRSRGRLIAYRPESRWAGRPATLIRSVRLITSATSVLQPCRHTPEGASTSCPRGQRTPPDSRAAGMTTAGHACEATTRSKA